MVDLQVERLSKQGPSKDPLVFVLHGVKEGQRVVIGEDLRSLRARMKVALKTLERQDECQSLLLDGGVVQLVFFQFCGVIGDGMENVACGVRLEEDSTHSNSARVHL